MSQKQNQGGQSQEQRQANLAPENHNDEQDDHRSQAQEVAEQARNPSSHRSSPTESTKPADNPAGTVGLGAKDVPDVIDKMREMETSGRIDMDAFEGEPNHDDNVDKFGADKKLDGLRGDGT